MNLTSALCLSRGNQEMLDAAHADWLAQTMRWEKDEFVVVIDENPTIRLPQGAVVVEVPAGTNLGARRNAGLRACSLDLVAVWDDDDGHDPERLERQAWFLRKSVGGNASFLQDVLCEFADGYRAIGSYPSGWPQTLLAKRKTLLAAGGWSEGEKFDGDFALLMKLQGLHAPTKLIEHDRVLYRYRQHAENVTGSAHWAAIRERSIPLEKATWIHV